ncbi:porin family protein [Conservatibacter flavescens]|uniref:Uncharacterized protein n=1 Tax=Conservatibacter flavescens TaxID=28161 RepID=A0A2M8S4G3_9PAST|nr:porin family protein [Conservatibacter flavescens]PJG86021.1 hypothetical protein CVP05_02305 [Conservatibacter flavescens]
MKKYYFTSLVFLCSTALSAPAPSEQDALRLWQQHVQQSAQQQKEHVVYERSSTDTFTVDGYGFQVAHNVEAIGQALYIAINQQLWEYVTLFLAKYQQFPQHKAELVWFAQGALARVQGDLSSAEKYYRQLLQAQPDFVRAQLDLARILFEEKKNLQSTALFQQIMTQPLPENVLHAVKDYQHALKQRESWKSTFSLGYVYNQNLNQSPQQTRCLLQQAKQCLVYRRSPEVINAQGWRYDLTLQRRISLHDNHGIGVYVNSYGQFYPHHHAYNEHTIKAYGGYNFRTANTDLTVAPLIEYSTFGHHRYYHGWGGYVNWIQQISPRHLWSMQFEQKQHRYSEHYSAFTQADVSLLFGTWYYQPTPQATLFGGVDWQYRHTTDKTHSYQMFGTRFGVNYQFELGLNVTALTLLRRYDYQAYHAALGVTRRDNQRIYLAILSVPTWQFSNITPSLMIKHTRNKSNADFVYAYKQSEIQLNFEWSF